MALMPVRCPGPKAPGAAALASGAVWWNGETAAQALGVTPTAALGQALGQLQQHGFCILSGVIDPTTTAHLRERAIAAAMAHDTGQSEATWHVSSALTYDSTAEFENSSSSSSSISSFESSSEGDRSILM